MNCEKCQELVHDLLDGTLNKADELVLNTHLGDCLDCQGVRTDLEAILGFCRTHRGEYEPTPNEKALWLRIQNSLEAETVHPAEVPTRKGFFAGLMGRSWELSLPQLAAFAASIVFIVAMVTTVSLRRWQSGPVIQASNDQNQPVEAASINDRTMQQQQVINYWKQRIDVNKARWSPEMRETFDRNLAVIDQAVNDSMNELHRNPRDEVSAQMLNEALNDKLSLLKEFSDL